MGCASLLQVPANWLYCDVGLHYVSIALQSLIKLQKDLSLKHDEIIKALRGNSNFKRLSDVSSVSPSSFALTKG